MDKQMDKQMNKQTDTQKQTRKNVVTGYILIFALIIIAAIVATVVINRNKSKNEALPNEGETTEVNPDEEEQYPNEPNVPSEPNESGRISLYYDNAGASKLFTDNIPGDIPISDVEISFYEPSGVYIDATVEPGKLADYAEGRGAESAAALKAALKLLPESAELTADMAILSDGQGGVCVEPIALEVGGVSVDRSLIPRELVDAISRALSDGIKAEGLSVERITVTDSAMEIIGVPADIPAET